MQLGLGVTQAVALSLGLDDLAAVREPVEGRAGEALRSEHLGPGREGQVGGDDQAAALVGAGDDVEEQFRPTLEAGT
jgi:hypothetical protein